MATSDEQTPVENALTNSVLVGNLSRVSTTLKQFITASFLYRWLTKEPEPDVIVIDLRDTYTVGPFITLLDRLIDGFANAAQGSIIAHTGQRLGEAFIETPIRVSGGFVFLLGLIALLFAVLTPSVTQALIAIAISILGLLSTRNTTPLLQFNKPKHTNGLKPPSNRQNHQTKSKFRSKLFLSRKSQFCKEYRPNISLDRGVYGMNYEYLHQITLAKQ